MNLDGFLVSIFFDVSDGQFRCKIDRTSSKFTAFNLNTLERSKQLIDFVISNSILRPFQDYFSSYETGQSVGGRKRENPEKNTWHTRKQNLACLTCGQCGTRTHTIIIVWWWALILALEIGEGMRAIFILHMCVIVMFSMRRNIMFQS